MITLTNSGTSTLYLYAISTSPSEFATLHTCSSSLSAGARCTLSCTFTPRTPGSVSGSITISSNATGSPHTIQLTGTGVAPTFTPQTGWWWNPNESGRGFFLEQQGGTLFVSGYLYADDGRATWFVASGALNGQRFSAPMQTFRDGQSLVGTYRPPTQSTSPGTISLDFSATNAAAMSWPGGNVSLQRFGFGDNGQVSPPTAGAPESGWWWNSAESGRGFSIEVQGTRLFMAGYLYDTGGNPVWYVTSGSMGSPNSFSGPWQQFGNGQTMGGTYRAPSVTNPSVGEVRLNFSNPLSGVMTLPDGRQINLERFKF